MSFRRRRRLGWGVVLTEAKRLERLVDDLLDLARLGADRPSVAPEHTDLVALGREVESVWSRRCSAVGVPFTFVPTVAQAWTVTDPARVRQLVDGLLENALRVTPSGRPVLVEVRREAGPRGDVDVVEVRDGGPGLTDEDLAVAFEPSCCTSATGASDPSAPASASPSSRGSPRCSAAPSRPGTRPREAPASTLRLPTPPRPDGPRPTVRGRRHTPSASCRTGTRRIERHIVLHLVGP